ncbi:MAG: hypothetical protein KDD45_04515 [Bdellovibrionales bacterium]|nr:hypothetical protein [Bdellovibrionales bacterium]
MNSILQFMYGAAKLRDMLIEVSRQQQVSQGSDPAIIIGQIFYCLREKSNHEAKYQLLKLLVNKLERINLFY